MEDIKFKDVAHFYFGVLFLELKTSSILRISALTIRNRWNIWAYDIDEENKEYLKKAEISGKGFMFSEIKPLLRPLCSITEFEALEFGKMVLDKDISHVSVITKNEKEDSVKMLFSNKTEMIEITDYYILAQRLFEQTKPMEVVSINNYGKIIVWLTGNGFDIFGLIKSMEALKAE